MLKLGIAKHPIRNKRALIRRRKRKQEWILKSRIHIFKQEPVKKWWEFWKYGWFKQCRKCLRVG